MLQEWWGGRACFASHSETLAELRRAASSAPEALCQQGGGCNLSDLVRIPSLSSVLVSFIRSVKKAFSCFE